VLASDNNKTGHTPGAVFIQHQAALPVPERTEDLIYLGKIRHEAEESVST